MSIIDISESHKFKHFRIPVVRLFKTGTEFNAGFVWEGDKPPVSCCGTPGALIRLLEEAVDRNESAIVIRADSERLVKNFEARMEVSSENKSVYIKLIF